MPGHGPARRGVFGDRHVVYEAGQVPGRNGVAVLTRVAPAAVRTWDADVLMRAPGEEHLHTEPAPLGFPLARGLAHTPQDVASWRRNQKAEGFLPEERKWIGAQLSPRTLVDVVRRLHPHADGPYS